MSFVLLKRMKTNVCVDVDAQATCDYSKLYLPTRSRITRMNLKFSESNRQFHTVCSIPICIISISQFFVIHYSKIR